jgi:hypothetical protein
MSTIIALPSLPLPQSASPQPIVVGGWQSPPANAEDQWVERIGTRMSMVLTTPNLRPEPTGRYWTAALLDALDSGALVQCRFPQPGLRIGAPGYAITVDGADQAGSVLNLKGFTPGYAIRRRQFFHIERGDLTYIHRATANLIVGADGKASVPIAPMLRFTPDDGTKCEFGAPVITGRVSGDAKGWTMVIARVQGLTFTISEIA